MISPRPPIYLSSPVFDNERAHSHNLKALWINGLFGLNLKGHYIHPLDRIDSQGLPSLTSEENTDLKRNISRGWGIALQGAGVLVLLNRFPDAPPNEDAQHMSETFGYSWGTAFEPRLDTALTQADKAKLGGATIFSQIDFEEYGELPLTLDGTRPGVALDGANITVIGSDIRAGVDLIDRRLNE